MKPGGFFVVPGGVGAGPDTGRVLSALQQTILEFEDANPRHHIRKTEWIRLEFGMHTARYYQLLAELVRLPDVIAEHPLLAGRVARLEGERVQRRRDRAETRRTV